MPVPIAASTVAFGTLRRRARPALRRRRHRLEPQPRLPRAARRRAPGKRDRTGAAGADPRRRRHAAGRRPGRGPRTPARQRRDRRHRRSRRRRRRRPAEQLARHGFAADTPVGISGLERAFNTRLAGKPGRQAAGRRRNRRLGPHARRGRAQAGRPGEDDDRPRPAGIGGRRPGRARRRHRRARRPQRRRPRPRRPGLLGPPAPGLDLQDDHHDRRPQERPRLARRRIRNHQRRQRRRPLHQQRQRRVLRRHLPPGLRRVLQRRLRPARARRSATTNWSTPPNASASTRPPPSTRRSSSAKSNLPESTIPTEIGEEIDLGVSRDRPGRSAGDAAADGERGTDDRQRRRPRADLDRRQQEAAPARRSRCG